MNFYIQDSTIGKYATFNTVPELVKYFDQMIPRAFKMSRAQYVQNLLDLGYGYDDAGGVMLTRAMADQFNMGVIKNNTFVRTDIHEAVAFKNDEFGENANNRFEDRGKF